jgi:hypothetical protein
VRQIAFEFLIVYWREHAFADDHLSNITGLGVSIAGPELK